MEQFNSFDPNSAGELNIVRNGWFYPSFILTDGVNKYGKLSYTYNWRRVGIIETAQQCWNIEFGKLFTRDILINDASTGQTIAVVKTTLWRGKVSLEFTDGQTLLFRREGIFSRKHIWYSEQYGNLLSTESRLFSFKQPFKVRPEQSTFKNYDYLVLLAFLSVHLILIRRARVAATVH